MAANRDGSLIIRENRFGGEPHLLQTISGLRDHFARAADQSDWRFQFRQDVIQQRLNIAGWPRPIMSVRSRNDLTQFDASVFPTFGLI